MAKKPILGYDERLRRCQCLNVLEVADVAVMMNRSENRIRHMVQARAIPHYCNERGNITFLKSEIEEWLLGRRIATETEILSQASTRVAISAIK
ncbi:MAG: helix-turn-helix domain-containing protein [Bacteroides sp.]|nr:helix-turn-helix domain-containing protein [Bacteroides sp.]